MVWRENLDLDKNFKFRVSTFTKKAKKEFRLLCHKINLRVFRQFGLRLSEDGLE